MPNNYVLLERIELNASAASITFNNIPQTGYTDLKVVVSARSDTAALATESYVQFNGITTATYSYRRIYAQGTTVGSDAVTNSATGGFIGQINASTSTVSTFSNNEFYIPNYTSSNAKSFSNDSVRENNATDGVLYFVAGISSGTAAITSVKITPVAGNLVQYSTFSLYGLAAVGTTPAIAPKASGGNIIDFDGTYWIHTFLSSGTFTPQTGLICDYLVVAGGGSGGKWIGAGGGAGGLRSTVTATGGGGSLESNLSVVSGTSYAITIGAGGASQTSSSTAGNNGSDSTFSTVVSTGGGGGGAYSNVAGRTGGSGGGGGHQAIGGSGTTNQGFAGGSAVTAANFQSAGGGGAGAVGASSTGSGPGAGGNGVATSITGSSISYGGGGGGTSNAAGSASGGTGGGGAGSFTAGVAGTVNTGGGGGGNGDGGVSSSGAGGSGIVIIRYLP
jgi:hypothetical protein